MSKIDHPTFTSRLLLPLGSATMWLMSTFVCLDHAHTNWFFFVFYIFLVNFCYLLYCIIIHLLTAVDQKRHTVNCTIRTVLIVLTNHSLHLSLLEFIIYKSLINHIFIPVLTIQILQQYSFCNGIYVDTLNSIRKMVKDFEGWQKGQKFKISFERPLVVFSLFDKEVLIIQ